MVLLKLQRAMNVYIEGAIIQSHEEILNNVDEKISEKLINKESTYVDKVKKN